MDAHGNHDLPVEAVKPKEPTVMSDLVEKYAGPCCICGGENYELSMGGQTICPSCDAGNFTPATVMRQAQAMKKLNAELDRLRVEREKMVEGLREIESFTRDVGDDDPLSHVCGVVRSLLSQVSP